MRGEAIMPKITHNRAFPYEDRESDILVGTLGGDGGDEDDATYGFDDKQDGSDVLSVHFDGTDGNDQVFGGPNDDTIKGGKGLDALCGEGGDDWIYGGADRDWLFGGDGQDHLFGEDGCDDLYGDAGQDVLYGGELSDLLDGGAGSDILVGGEGADWLTGGSGYDSFQINWENLFKHDSPAFQPDVIMDFSSFDDVIELIGTGPFLSPAEYVEATIDYGAGYEKAREQALSLLESDDKQYAFVTDGVDGYLFVEVYPNDALEDVEIGVILKGLTALSDFDATDLFCV
jgi:Ca2+-binding RTX toxin-like protein